MAIKLCEKYDSLTPIQRITMVGEIVHAMQIDTDTFEMVEKLINFGYHKGIFTGVQILPTDIQETNTDNQ